MLCALHRPRNRKIRWIGNTKSRILHENAILTMIFLIYSGYVKRQWNQKLHFESARIRRKIRNEDREYEGNEKKKIEGRGAV